VVLVVFPFTDLSGHKLRPALIVGRPSGEDLILAFLSSRESTTDPQADYVLGPGDPEFSTTGLKSQSVVRLNRIATLHRQLIRRRLGHIGPRTQGAVVRGLRYVFEL
jgi:mRNA interferase MazF